MSFGRLGSLGRGFGRLGSSAKKGAGVAPGSPYTLPASTGTFILTGDDMAPLVDRKLPSAVGAFTLTGVAATLTYTSADAAETTAFLARTTGLDATHTNAYKALINGLVADGVFAKIDALYLMSTQDSTTALLNLKSTSFSPLTASGGTPTFAADRGHTFNGSNFFLSGFTPSTAGGVYVLNSAHIMLWSNTTGNSTGGEIGSASAGNGFIIANGSGTNSKFQVNTGTDFNDSTSTGAKFYLASRTASNNTTAYWGASGTLNTLGSTATASTSLPNSDMTIGAINGFGTTTKQLSAGGWGSSLNGTDAANYYSRMQTFMTAVGN